MTVKTPSFIISECERLIQALPLEHKKRAEEILEQLYLWNDFTAAIDLMEKMHSLEEYCVPSKMMPRLFKRSYISETLIKAFEQEESSEETKSMLETVKKMASFEEDWCEYDASFNMDRTFWVIRRQKDWKRICARAKELPSNGSIKIALEIKKPKKLKTAEKVWEEDAHKVKKFLSARFYYEIWFRQTEKAYYHIYLP